MKRSALRVSDHALVRWLERVYGLNVDKLRECILDAPGLRAAVEGGARSVTLEGVEYIFGLDGTLKTIATPARRRAG
ncbi:MAG: hypothetical protein KIS96_11355 [Bauldia sp.]|nr:hypothetical protein [Bauldia sp.]